jgi:hypothetical protein
VCCVRHFRGKLSSRRAKSTTIQHKHSAKQNPQLNPYISSVKSTTHTPIHTCNDSTSIKLMIVPLKTTNSP